LIGLDDVWKLEQLSLVLCPAAHLGLGMVFEVLDGELAECEDISSDPLLDDRVAAFATLRSRVDDIERFERGYHFRAAIAQTDRSN